MNKIIISNLNDDTEVSKNRGWMVGHFAKPPFSNKDFELKWSKHKKGEKKTKLALNKTAKTVWILISGKVKIVFPENNKEIVMEKEGDYCFYSNKVKHSWEILEDCISINIRWPSVPNDQVEDKQ